MTKKLRRQLFNSIRGQILSAFKDHPSYHGKTARIVVVNSIAKRVYGQLIHNPELLRKVAESIDSGDTASVA